MNLPLDMKARLSLRNTYTVKRLNFDGGIIDPGYRGHLFITLANLGDSTIEIQYGDPLITAEFVRLPHYAKQDYMAVKGYEPHESIDEVGHKKITPVTTGD